MANELSRAPTEQDVYHDLQIFKYPGDIPEIHDRARAPHGGMGDINGPVRSERSTKTGSRTDLSRHHQGGGAGSNGHVRRRRTPLPDKVRMRSGVPEQHASLDAMEGFAFSLFEKLRKIGLTVSGSRGNRTRPARLRLMT